MTPPTPQRVCTARGDICQTCFKSIKQSRAAAARLGPMAMLSHPCVGKPFFSTKAGEAWR